MLSRGGAVTRPPQMLAFEGFPEGKNRFIAYGNVILRCKTTGRVTDPPLQKGYDKHILDY